MALLVAGLALWVAAHLFKRAAPEARAALEARLGAGAAKGALAAVLALSVLLIVVGYRGAPFIPVYAPPAWGVHLNNLAMFFAIALFGLGSSKSQLRGTLRHPQLTGFALWAAAHLLVNGDLHSLVLFGTMLVWALVEIPVLNATTARPEPFEGGSWKGTLRLALIAAALYAVITAIHAWLGVWPFAG